MPDTLETAQAAAPSDNGQIQDVAAMMAASLNPFTTHNKISVPEQPGTPQADVPRETPATTSPPAQEVPAAPQQPDPLPFQFTTFTEKFGYKNPEDAIKEIEELRAFKNAPGVPAAFKDEEAAAIYKALADGKYDDVRLHLDRQHRINSLMGLDVNKDTAADIVKYGMQLKYKDLTPQEIDYKFNKQFAVPSKPVQQVDEDLADYEARVSQWQQVAADKQMELMIEAKMIRPEFESAKKQFNFPKAIESPDEGYRQYQEMLAKETQLQDETVKAYQSFQPAAVATKLKFVDEPNKIDFEFQYEPDKESFGKTVQMVSDVEQFWKSFQKPDGTPDREKFLKIIHYGMNHERYMIEAMTQAKNAAIKAQLPDNSQGGLIRQMPQGQEVSELDQQMRASLRGYGGY